MISTADFKPGLTIEVNGIPHQIVEFQHVKPGKGPAFVRTRLKNLLNQTVVSKTWNAGEKVEPAMIERRGAQYLYAAGDEYTFMDLDSYDQMELGSEIVGDQAKYLSDGLECQIVLFKGKVITLEIPLFLELEVTQTDPGIRGDTATGGTKPATLAPGAVVMVPLFVNTGDVIKVDTRTDSYIERVTK